MPQDKGGYESLIGFIECKNYGENLTPLIKGKQIEKYLSVCHNIILTDYNRFILLSFGRVVADLVLFDSLESPQNAPQNATQNATKDSLNQAKLIEISTRFAHLLGEFFHTSAQIAQKDELVKVLSTQSFYLSTVIFNAQNLAQNAGQSPQNLTQDFGRDLGQNAQDFTQTFPQDFAQNLTQITAQTTQDSEFKAAFAKSYQSFRNLESTDISEIEFCDILAQSIVYGAFVAHIESEIYEIDKIPPEMFVSLLPKHFITLREFIESSLPARNLPDSIAYALSNIIKTIALIDKPSLARSFAKEISEVSIYLYEDFLRAYDELRGEQKRKEGGVFYTPEPIVNMITRSINALLKKHFGKSFSDEGVKVLDFATGTGSFLSQVFELILSEQSEVFAKQTILQKCFRDIYGFEISFVPYIVAHLKLSSILRAKGFSEFSASQKFQVYLTNTLDLDAQRQIHLQVPFDSLKNERDKSLELKHKENLLVILGNPPYNVKSKNKGKEILALLDSYKMGLNETNIQPLDDDYIKFIRFAQWKLLEQRQQSGVMGFISNNSFLYGRTHRKMRESLAKSFDEIYILNLHGDNAEDKNDKNVFDIRVGVCISLFVKYRDSSPICHNNALSCHTERSEVSQSVASLEKTKNRDISAFSKPQYDNDRDCHESATFNKVADSRNDNKISPSLAEGVQGVGNPSLRGQQPEAIQNNNDDLATIHYFSTKDNDIVRRADKFALLNDIAHNGLDCIKWQNLTLDSPYFWFVPKDFSNDEYENFWALAKNKALGESKAIFEISSSGIKTQQDKVAIAFSTEQMQRVLQDFATLDKTALASKYNIHDSRDWQIERAKAEVMESYSNSLSCHTELSQESEVSNNNAFCHTSEQARSMTKSINRDISPAAQYDNGKMAQYDKYRDSSLVSLARNDNIMQIAYRPFDLRYTFTSGRTKGFLGYPRFETMKHFLQGENLGICFPKTCLNPNFDYGLVIDKIADIALGGKNTGSETYIAPLYIYPDELLQGEKTPNFTREFNEYKQKHKVLKDKTPEQILAFIYANLYNPNYRDKYIEYLKIGFPRIDFEVSQSHFEKLAELGQNLIDLHLMRTIPHDKTIDLKFRENADRSNPNFALDTPKFDAEQQKIVLNSDLEIIGISAEVWDYTIGGYKVLDKWLKYRTNDKRAKNAQNGDNNGAIMLSQADFTHIVNVAKILKATISLQSQLTRI